jgi:hypothetical protein
MSRILFVDSLSIEDNPMSTCYILKCQKIKNDPRFYFYDIYQDPPPDPRQFSNVVLGCRSVYFYKRYRKNFGQILSKNRIILEIPHKMMILQDMHPKTYGSHEQLVHFLKENNIDIIFTYYQCPEAQKIRKLVPNVKHYHLPHHMDTKIFYDRKLPKDYDILLYGSTQVGHYRFRKRLFDLILKHQDIFRIYHIPWPDKYDPQVCEEGLAKLINRSKICISTRSRYDYLLGKYFEIGMCRSLIAGDIPTDGTSFLRGRMLELRENMDDTEIIRSLQNALEHYGDYQTHMDHLYDHLHSHFSLDTYTEDLLRLINPRI